MGGMCSLSAEFGGENYIRRVRDTAVLRTGLCKQMCGRLQKLVYHGLYCIVLVQCIEAHNLQ